MKTMIDVLEIAYSGEASRYVSQGSDKYLEVHKKFDDIWTRAVFNPERHAQYPELDLDQLFKIARKGYYNREVIFYDQTIEDEEALDQLVIFIRETAVIVSRLEIYGYRWENKDTHHYEESYIDVTNSLSTPVRIFTLVPGKVNNERLQKTIDTAKRLAHIIQNVSNIYRDLGSNVFEAAREIDFLGQNEPYYARSVLVQIGQLAKARDRKTRDIF